MFSRRTGLDALRAEAQAWARRAQLETRAEGRLKYAQFAIYLAAFALIAFWVDSAARKLSLAVAGLQLLSFVAAAYSLYRVRQHAFLARFALNTEGFDLAALRDTALMRARPLWVQLTLRTAAITGEVNALIARASSIDVLRDFRLPQLTVLCCALAQWVRGLLPSDMASPAPLRLPACALVSLPAFTAPARFARPLSIALRC
jgi:hypothetical protein